MSTENTTDKRYVSLNRLSNFLDHLRIFFATKDEVSGKADENHDHLVEDITDFQTVLDTIDTAIETKTAPAGTDLGTVMSGGNVEISNGIITVQDNLHNHTIENVNGLQEELNAKVDTETFASHAHNDIYYTKSETDGKVSEINSSIEYIIDGTTPVAEAIRATNADNATNAVDAEKAIQDASGNIITSTYETKDNASAKLAEAKAYADGVKNDLLSGAGEAYNTLKELGDLIDDNHDAIDALEIVATGKQNKLAGSQGQIVGFNAEGNAIAQDSAHASTHAIGGSDPITSSDIGAAAADEQQWKHYDNLNDIGLTAGSETLADIFTAMPNYSILRYVGTSAHNAAIYPNGSPYGQVEFIKSSGAYGHGTFFADTNNANRGTYELYYNQGNVYGWFRNYGEHNKPTANDIGAASASEQKWKHYSSLDHIGLTAGSETIDSIIINMPSFSVLEYVVGTNCATIYPSQYGLVRFVKADTSRFFGWFYPKNSTDVYHCAAIRESGVLTFNDWVKEYNTGNKPTASDIGAMPYYVHTTALDFDSDEAKTFGIHVIGYAPVNAPCSNWGTLIVDNKTGTPYQLYIPDGNNMVFYKRTIKTAGASWSKISNSANDIGAMAKSTYDPNNAIANAGGIAAWITANYDNAEAKSY